MPRTCERRTQSYRFTLPLLLLIPMLWLMIGCIYIPWFEHPLTDKSNKDFRPLLAADQEVGPIQIGHTSRDQIFDLLGLPDRGSLDGRIVYDSYDASNGFWVWPLCFSAGPGNVRTFTLEVEYAENDLVKNLHVSEKNEPEAAAGPLYARKGRVDFFRGYPARSTTQPGKYLFLDRHGRVMPMPHPATRPSATRRSQ